MSRDDRPFWQRKRLDQMTKAEWESLCDGCGKCCLHKLEDEDTEEIFYTNVACKLLDLKTCQCANYAKRKTLVPDCIQLSPANIGNMGWMPKTCAYRLLDEGKDLPAWHPLRTGDPKSVHTAGISWRGKLISEVEVDIDNLEPFIVEDEP
jgi:uncharacterized protein